MPQGRTVGPATSIRADALARIIPAGQAAGDGQQSRRNAQYCLGFCYVQGQGVAQDYTEGLKWSERAANQGYAASQSILGTLYAKGQGVRANHVLAYKWWSLAAAAKYPGAAKDLATLTAKMPAENVAKAQKMVREWKPKLEIDD